MRRPSPSRRPWRRWTSSPILFGGDDDFSDLDDAWLLKLGNASLRHTSDPRFEFHLSPSFHFAFCGWRFQGKSQELWDASCGANATTSPMEDCEFVEVLLAARWFHRLFPRSNS